MDTSSFILTPESIDYLTTIRKWALFLSIIGFIAVAILVLMGIFIGFIFNVPAFFQSSGLAFSTFSTIASFAYIIMAIIYFIPVWFLFQFSRKLKRALIVEDEIILSESFRNLKNTFVVYGILVILGIIFYALLTAFGFFTAMHTVNGLTV